MNKPKSTLVLALSSLLGASALAAQQAALTTKDSPIWEEPRRSANQIMELQRDTELEVVKRRGGWYLIEYHGQQIGWIPLLNVRFKPQEEEEETTIADILRQTAEMPTAAGRTTGVRGMTKDKLNNDSQSPAPTLDEMDFYVPTEEDLKHFLEEGELQEQKQIELDDY